MSIPKAPLLKGTRNGSQKLQRRISTEAGTCIVSFFQELQEHRLWFLLILSTCPWLTRGLQGEVNVACKGDSPLSVFAGDTASLFRAVRWGGGERMRRGQDWMGEDGLWTGEDGRGWERIGVDGRGWGGWAMRGHHFPRNFLWRRDGSGRLS